LSEDQISWFSDVSQKQSSKTLNTHENLHPIFSLLISLVSTNFLEINIRENKSGGQSYYKQKKHLQTKTVSA